MAPQVPVSVAWIRAGTELFIDHVDIADLAAPSRLPGWTNGHVAAHVARNAEAIERLLTWAQTGVETPMYASPDARDADIERDAHRPAEMQLADVRSTAQSLARTLGTLDDQAWTASVRTVQGRSIAASDVPWMRVKEVWLHAVDIGASVDDLPSELVDAMLTDIATAIGAKDSAPGLRLIADSGRELIVGDGGIEISGRAADLLGWLSGRSSGEGLTGDLPALPAWL